MAEDNLILTELTELRKSHDLFPRILNRMYYALMIIDRDYMIVDVNNSLADSYDKHQGEIVGRTCYEITHRVA